MSEKDKTKTTLPEDKEFLEKIILGALMSTHFKESLRLLIDERKPQGIEHNEWLGLLSRLGPDIIREEFTKIVDGD